AQIFGGEGGFGLHAATIPRCRHGAWGHRAAGPATYNAACAEECASPICGGLMTEGVQNYPVLAGSGSAVDQRNRVLRNTYWLLALSMVPTVLGAWIGVQTGITRSLTGGLGLIVFLAGAFGFMFAIEKFKNSAAG